MKAIGELVIYYTIMAIVALSFIAGFFYVFPPNMEGLGKPEAVNHGVVILNYSTSKETPKSLSSAEELKLLFARDLFRYERGYTETLSYEESPDLIELATVNAKNGTNSIRLAGDNGSEAYYAYTLYLRARAKQNGYYFGSEDQNKVTSVLRAYWNNPGSYGLSVYQDGNHYNVCAVLRSHNLDESVKDKSGAYSVRKVPDTITYLWAD